jgi:hypothetical protein
MTTNAPVLNLVANGNVGCSRFVRPDASLDYAALQGDSSSVLLGISQIGSANPPGVTGSTAYAASAGKSFYVYTGGQICYVEAGGSITRGDLLGSDDNGRAITKASGQIGAIALQSGAANDKIRVLVLLAKY